MGTVCRGTSAGKKAALPPLSAGIVPAHFAYVRGLAARLGVLPADVDDVVQQVLFAAHDSPSPLEARALLYGVTRHVIAKRREWQTHQWEAEDAWEASETTAPAADELHDAAAAAREAAETVQEAIDALPEMFREVFVRVEVDGQEMPSVAAALGLNVNTGYNRLRLARQRFREAVLRRLARTRP